VIILKTKKCSKCGRELPLTEIYFFKRKETKDGFRADCKECRGRRFTLPSDEIIPDGYKKCHICKQILPFESFNKSSDNKDGLQHRCKDCKKQYRAEHKDHIAEHYKKWRNNHKEELSEYSRQWKKEHKEQLKQYRIDHKDKIKEYNKKYREEHLEYFALYKKEHGQEHWRKNKEHYLAYARKRRNDNKEATNKKDRMYAHKRRAIIQKLESTLTIEQWETIKEYFNNCCAYCGKERPLAQEHFIPLSKGGAYTHNNIIPACKSCNSSKHDKDFSEWYPEHENYNPKREKTILKFLGYDKQGTQQPALMI